MPKTKGVRFKNLKYISQYQKGILRDQYDFDQQTGNHKSPQQQLIRDRTGNLAPHAQKVKARQTMLKFIPPLQIPCCQVANLL